jgi:hypothetical protein
MAEPGLPAAQRAPALVFAGFLLLIAASGAVLFVEKVGLGAASVRDFYLGSEARFTSPRSLVGLLEIAVPHLVAVPLVLFAVIHVVAAAGRLGPRLIGRLAGASFAIALAGVAAGFGVRYLAPWLAWGKVAAFVGLEAVLVAWAGLLAAAAWPGPGAASRPGRGGSQPGQQPGRGLEDSLGIDQHRLGPGVRGEPEAVRTALDHHRLGQDLGLDGGRGQDADRPGP